MSLLLNRPGAFDGTGVDQGVAAHYGDPHREQLLLSEGLAVVDLSHRGVVTVTGPDRLSWLHSLTTQLLTGLAPRTSTETLILSPKGRIEHALHVVDDGSTTWLTTEPGDAPAVAAWLESMRFMLRVEVADDGRAGGAWVPGVGLTSMRERAAELDGTVSWRGTPDGSTVVALLPCGPVPTPAGPGHPPVPG